MKRWSSILFLLLALLIAGGVIFRAQLAAYGRSAYASIASRIPAPRSPLSAARSTLSASGTIEATTVDSASPIGGRIAALHASEGQRVAAGDLIAEMDTALLDADIAAAKAAQAVAEAQVAQLKAGARQADLDVPRAAIRQAEAGRAAAKQAAADAAALVTAPGDLDVKIVQAAGTLNAAQEQVAAAEAAAQAADLEQAMWGRIVKLLEEGFDVPLPIPGGGTTHVDAPANRLNPARLQWNLASQKTWEMHAKAVAAAAARDVARQSLADLRSQRANPQALKAQANAANAALATAEAGVQTAQAALEVAQAGATAEQIAASQAVADQAAAAVRTLQARWEQTAIVAPRAGTITAVVRHAGEVVGAGVPIVTLADLGEVSLTVYVPEAQLSQVQPGGAASVTVDSFPDRAFPGRVTLIGSQAEFTPKNIQTREERTRLVFPVKLTLANPDAALKPGMPADATFGGTETQGQKDPGSPTTAPRPPAESQYSGTIEATEIAVAAELGGRAVAVFAAEGDPVSAGQALVELDGTELAARRAQAQAVVAAATADLARVRAAPQAARVAQAQAQVAQAEALLAGARTATEDARELRENPQELDAQINVARGQLATAAAAVDTAQAGVKAAQVLQQSLPSPGSDDEKTRRAVYDQQVIAAEAGLLVAQAQQRGIQATLAQLQAIRRQPAALDAAVHRAEAEAVKAEAAVEMARALLGQVQAPAQEQALAVAGAKVALAQAGLAQVDAAATKLTIASPASGIVTVQAIHTGEVAQPGAALLTVADLGHLKLVVYIPAEQLGQARLDQPVEVTVDAYPAQVFPGRVTRIADQAEFTPKNVQTKEERVKTVFAVEISLDNPDGRLKPGMPADATIRSG